LFRPVERPGIVNSHPYAISFIAPGRPIAVGALVLALLVCAATAHAGRRKAPGCQTGRFVATAGHELLGDPAIPTVLMLRDGKVTIEGPCPGAGKAGKPRRTGTPITVRWKRCGGSSRVRLVATAPDCSGLAGTVRAGKRRARFAAVRATSTECGEAGHPCAWNEVPLEMVARSLALSEDAIARMEAGASATEVGAFLGSQSDMAEVTVDGSVILFRLAGGRPMIVDFAGEQEMRRPASPGAPAAAARAVTNAAGSPRRTPHLRGITAQVVPGDGLRKRALVLSPFRYEAGFGAGAEIAAALGGVRGYDGTVTLLETTDERAPQVTVETLTRLADYDVIHIDTHGGSICKTKEPPAAAAGVTNTTGDCAASVTDFLVQRFHGTAEDLRSVIHPGVVHYRGRLHQSIAVTADFFRYFYPNGLPNTLFILGACNTYRPDMASAIAGDEGIYLSWDRFTDIELVRTAGLSLADALGKGVTVDTAFRMLPPLVPGNPDAAGSRLLSTGRAAGGDLRIRELPSVRDAFTGEELGQGSLVEVTGVVEDGRPDGLLLIIEIDGAMQSEASRYVVRVAIDGSQVVEEPLDRFAARTGDSSWRSDREIPLGYDARLGQTIDIEVSVSLPEGGTSTVAASPTVSGPAQGFQPGRVWQGTFKRIFFTDETQVQLDVQAVFERDPDQNPDTKYPTFLLKSGTMVWSAADSDGSGCSFQAPIVTTQLGPDPDANFSFDLTKDPVEFRGFASSEGPVVEIMITCPEIDPFPTKTEAGGVWLAALGSDHHVVTGYSFSGRYDQNGPRPSSVQWNLRKVE